jgi:hypothetical protein
MLKDQVVALSLELEDKIKIVHLLKRKVSSVKAELPKVEEGVIATFGKVFQVWHPIDLQSSLFILIILPKRKKIKSMKYLGQT